MKFLRVTLPPSACGRLTVELVESVNHGPFVANEVVHGVAEFTSFAVMGPYAKALKGFLERGEVQPPFHIVH